MSTIEIILTRMMHEAVFTDAVFENADTALMEYNLLFEEVSRFKTLSRSQFSAMTLEDRKAFASWVANLNGKNENARPRSDLAAEDQYRGG